RHTCTRRRNLFDLVEPGVKSTRAHRIQQVDAHTSAEVRLPLQRAILKHLHDATVAESATDRVSEHVGAAKALEVGPQGRRRIVTYAKAVGTSEGVGRAIEMSG